MGRLEINKGKTAQWIAQAIDADMPSASHLSFEFIRNVKITKRNNVAKNIVLYVIKILLSMAFVNLQ